MLIASVLSPLYESIFRHSISKDIRSCRGSSLKRNVNSPVDLTTRKWSAGLSLSSPLNPMVDDLTDKRLMSLIAPDQQHATMLIISPETLIFSVNPLNKTYDRLSQSWIPSHFSSLGFTVTFQFWIPSHFPSLRSPSLSQSWITIHFPSLGFPVTFTVLDLCLV